MGKSSISLSFLSLTCFASQAHRALGLPHPQPQTRNTILNSSYLNVEFGQPRSDIEAYSLSTMSSVAHHHYHPDGYQKNGFFALAEWDLEHGTNKFEKQVNDANKKYETHPGHCYDYYKTPLVNSWNDFVSWASLGLLEAQAAYNTSDMSLVEGAFQFLSEHGYITQADLDAGYLVGTKDSSDHLSATCNGQSMLGGVYERNGCPKEKDGRHNASVSAAATSLYALLGAKLCRATGNTTYCGQAYSSLQFVDRLLKRSDGLIGDYINASDCSIATHSPFAYDSGLYVAAYADLGNYTNNATAVGLAKDTAVAAMVTTVWNDARGIITEGAGHDVKKLDFALTYGPILIRSLHQAYQYLDSTTQAAILQYINIQYYAITQLDSNDHTKPHKYGRNWTGPYKDVTDQSMVAALDVLNGINLNPDSAFPTAANKSAPVAMIVS